MATTHWKPDTHDIEFSFIDGGVSFISNDPKYIGRDSQEVYDEVLAEHVAINTENV